jgi:hypothetical protein
MGIENALLVASKMVVDPPESGLSVTVSPPPAGALGALSLQPAAKSASATPPARSPSERRVREIVALVFMK